MADHNCLIFDYDGTLHETMALYKSAVCDVIEKQKGTLLPSDTPLPVDEQFRKWIGMNAEDMWKNFLPELEADKRQQAILEVGQTMSRLIDTKSRWYAGAEEMLDGLKEAGFCMLVLSNCTELYAKAHWAHFRMNRWFDAFLASESFADQPKEGIIASLLVDPEAVLQKAVCTRAELHGTERFRRVLAVIGDKASDKRGALSNGLSFIGCTYGYGTAQELEGSFALADAPGDIIRLIRLLKN